MAPPKRETLKCGGCNQQCPRDMFSTQQLNKSVRERRCETCCMSAAERSGRTRAGSNPSVLPRGGSLPELTSVHAVETYVWRLANCESFGPKDTAAKTGSSNSRSSSGESSWGLPQARQQLKRYLVTLRWQLHNNTSSSTVGKDDISKIASCNRAVERVLADGLTHPTVMQFWISLEGIINDVMRLLSAPISETILEERPVGYLERHEGESAVNSTVPGRPDKRQRSRASQEGEKVLTDRLKLVPDGLEAVVNDLVASRAQTCKCEIDVRRLSLFIQFLADTALIQQGKPTHLDLSCMKHLPAVMQFLDAFCSLRFMKSRRLRIPGVSEPAYAYGCAYWVDSSSELPAIPMCMPTGLQSYQLCLWLCPWHCLMLVIFGHLAPLGLPRPSEGLSRRDLWFGYLWRNWLHLGAAS